MTNLEPTDLDELMARDPLDLTEQDIVAIIAYHRNIRAKRMSGEKPVRAKTKGADLSAIATKLIVKPEVPKLRRI